MGTTLKIPMLFGYDAVHGASAVPGVTLFPHNLGMGAIQDTLLIQKAFRVGALEVRGVRSKLRLWTLHCRDSRRPLGTGV